MAEQKSEDEPLDKRQDRPQDKPRHKPINRRQQRFVEEYVIDFNGRQAAIRAGYTKAAASHTASLLLRRPDVAEAVGEAIEERRKHTLITADRVLQEYARIAFADMRRLTRWGPEGLKLKPDSALSDDDAAAVAEVSSGGRTGRGTRIKLHDKRRALDSIARHLGLFDARHTADAKAIDEAGARAREILEQRIAALAKRK